MIDDLKIDFKKLEEKKERNRIERIKFMDFYTKWLMKTPNAVWSEQHAKFIDSGFAAAKEHARQLNKK